jgi:predicted dithiol-disulfide oxidoreductase (DUF899 family)
MPLSLVPVTFPGESKEYRVAREELLQAEIELRRHTEKVAALRRRLPPGGKLPQDYAFTGLDGQTVHLSELFGAFDTLLLYSMMYAPDATRPCPMCTAIVDALNGSARCVTQRSALAVVGRAEPTKLAALAKQQTWTSVRIVSSTGTTYNHDYHAEENQASQLPILNVFYRIDGVMHHFWASEMLFHPPDEGQNERHVDIIWPLWNLLDLLPTGRGTDWFPTLDGSA